MKAVTKKRSFRSYKMRRFATILFFLICCSAFAQQPEPAIRMAAAIVQRDTATLRWTYEEALVWEGLERLWYNTDDASYFKYVQQQVDRLVDQDGNIHNYDPHDFNLDNILGGRTLLLLYEVTNQEKYYKAATILRGQLNEQPRTTEGSFWHKKKYPHQVWLDGLYMAQPFWAGYATLFHEDSAFDDIAHQFAV